MTGPESWTDQELDEFMGECYRNSRVPSSPAFFLELSLYLTVRDLPPNTKLSEIPAFTLYEMAKRAGDSLEQPIN